MNFLAGVATLVLMTGMIAGAQVASHAPTNAQDLEKPVARVNGVVLTQRDLLTQMVEMFPYSAQHGGFPKDMEPQIRRGAIDMIIFNELAYQEAKRRGMTVAPARVTSTATKFRKRFPDAQTYKQYLQLEANGSPKVMRAKIERALLIQDFLSKEVTKKARPTQAQLKQYYDNNGQKFDRKEMFHIQSVSVIPPEGANAEALKQARRKAEDAAKKAKETKSYEEFGLLAEKVSEDDFRVNMGDHKPTGFDQLPPEIVKTAKAMKPGDVSDLIQLGSAYTIFRLVAHTPAGKIPFTEAKSKLEKDLQKERTEQVRAALGKTLRAGAKIEKL
jgi:peptidyl-prolyl cis-trans isomerase SurA